MSSQRLFDIVLNNQRNGFGKNNRNQLRQSHYSEAMRAHCPLATDDSIWLYTTIESCMLAPSFYLLRFERRVAQWIVHRKSLVIFELAASVLLLCAIPCTNINNIIEPPAVDLFAFAFDISLTLIIFSSLYSEDSICAQNQCHKEWRCIVLFCSKLEINAFMLCVPFVQRLETQLSRDIVYKQFIKMFNI